jgi:hypothetical protein
MLICYKTPGSLQFSSAAESGRGNISAACQRWAVTYARGAGEAVRQSARQNVHLPTCTVATAAITEKRRTARDTETQQPSAFI